jgi:hypothetical protein
MDKPYLNNVKSIEDIIKRDDVPIDVKRFLKKQGCAILH